MTNRIDPFNGNLAITPEGSEVRKSIKVEDVLLCQDLKETNDLMADTMAFIVNCLPKK
jgi:hypothetical protein